MRKLSYGAIVLAALGFVYGCADTASSQPEGSADRVITQLSVPGVVAPATGIAPVTTNIDTLQYSGTVSWTPDAATFAASTVYTAHIALTAKTGWTLSGVAANAFTVAGASASNDANSGSVTAVFPATGSAPLQVITLLDIPGVVAPVRGATPVTTAIDTAQYAGTIAWDPADSPFADDKVYAAHIALTAKTGWTLTGVSANTFTVDGASASHSANSGNVTAVFPKTGTDGPTALNPGDIAIIEFNGNGNDGFTFIPLVDLNAGTTIHFTDYGWDGSAILVAEDGTTIPPGGQGNMITYTAPTAVTAGTLIRQDSSNTGGSSFTATAAWLYNFNSYNFIYSISSTVSGHDGLMVFQGTPDAPRFIWAYHTGGWGQGGYANYYWSNLPSGLTDGTNAVCFPDLASGTDLTVDDGTYTGPVTAATAAVWRARLANRANWTTSASGSAPTSLYPGNYAVTK